MFMAVGLGLKVYGLLAPAATAPAAGETAVDVPRSPLARSLAPANPRTDSDAPSPESELREGEWSAEDWSALLFPLGLSFVVGFAMGYALRQFLRLALLIAGCVLLGVFGLQYAGVIEVDWSSMEEPFETVRGWLAEQTDGFREFINGKLPSAGSAGAGLWVGFRKR